MKKQPDFFIVGAPRSGTTAMSHFLGGHPEIFMARKEMHAFGADLCFGRRFYRRDLQSYQAEFNLAQGRQRAGEGSVWYLFSKTAAAEIHHFNPEAQIIIMLREPVEMISSLFHEFRFDGNEHLPSFESALAAEEDRRAGRRLSRRTYFPQGLVYRETACYADQVRRYLDTFGPEQVHVILYDDFALDPAGVFDGTIKFLGLQPAPARAQFRVINGNKQVRSPWLQKLMGDAWLRSAAIGAARRLPRPVFRALQAAEEKLWRLNTRLTDRAALPNPLRAQLRNYFAPEIEKLSRILQRDLSRWRLSRPDASPGDFTQQVNRAPTFTMEEAVDCNPSLKQG